MHLVLEFIRGGRLFSRIKKREGYTEEDARSIVRTLLAGVACLHDRNIIHRDIKPQNLMLAYDYQSNRHLYRESPNEPLICKIVNCALAKRMCGNQLETLCCGSPGYAAPEVLNREGYGLKADIFSCGIIMYQM